MGFFLLMYSINISMKILYGIFTFLFYFFLVKGWKYLISILISKKSSKLSSIIYILITLIMGLSITLHWYIFSIKGFDLGIWYGLNMS